MKLPSLPKYLGPLFLGVLVAAADISAQPSSDRRCSPPKNFNDGIRIGTLRSAKLDETRVSDGIREIRKGTYSNIHSVLIFRHGTLVCEEYFIGDDQNSHNGEKGLVAHTRETLHDTRSISKSVVALAVLVAHAQRKIKDLDQSIFEILPEYASLADGEKRSITIRHVLTMTAGLEWNENIAYDNPLNTASQMNKAPDVIEFVLARKLVNKPGSVFEYNGGLTQLLAAIIKKTTGSDVDGFAKRHILTPLGITKYEWAKLKTGGPDADSGLRLRSRDVAKIGLMVMNEGKWNGRQILSTRLIKDATNTWTKVSEEADGWKTHYGYQIWLQNFPDAGKDYSVIEFSGNGGQKVLIDRKNGLMVVITGGNYNATGLKKHSFDILLDIVYPSVKG